MRVLITGVAGHVGSALAGWIVDHKPGVEVVGVDDLSSGYLDNVPQQVHFLRENLSESAKCIAGGERFDAVFHFASYAAECFSPFARRHTITRVWLPTATVLNAILDGPGCGRLVLASSAAVYGAAPAPFDERAQCRPHDPYGVAKLACEHDLRIAGEQHGLDWCALRMHNLYGPGQSLWQDYRNVLGIWMRAALEGRPLQIFGDGRQRRAFSFMDDVLPSLWAAAVDPEASRQVVNLGGSQPTSILGAAELTAGIVGASAIEHVPGRHEVAESYCTTAKSEALLDYRDRTTLRAGIEKMWAWAQEAWQAFPERRECHERVPVEVRRGMPAAWRKANTPRVVLLIGTSGAGKTWVASRLEGLCRVAPVDATIENAVRELLPDVPEAATLEWNTADRLAAHPEAEAVFRWLLTTVRCEERVLAESLLLAHRGVRRLVVAALGVPAEIVRVVYLDTPPEQVAANVVERGREHERGYTVDMACESVQGYRELAGGEFDERVESSTEAEATIRQYLSPHVPLVALTSCRRRRTIYATPHCT